MRFSFHLNHKRRIIGIYCLVHLLLIYLLGDSYFFAPDESDYIKSIFDTYNDLNVENQLPGWGMTNKLLIKIIFFPAKLLSILGFSHLTSLRMYSVIISVITFLILLSSFKKIEFSLRSPQAIWIALLFTPTLIIWGSLSIREPFIYFCLVFSFKIMSTMENDRTNRINALLLTLVCLLLFAAKFQLYFVFAISTILALLVVNKSANRIAKVVIPILIIPLILLPKQSIYLFHNFSYYLQANNSKMIELALENQNQNQNQNQYVPSRTEDLVRLDSKSTLANLFSLTQEWGFSTSSKVENQSRRTLLPPKFQDVKQVFLSMIKVLCLPLPLVDNGSYFLNLLSLEWPIWIIAYVLLVRNFYKVIIKKDFQSPVIYSMLFFCLIYTMQSVFTETNLGTNYRHRSILLLMSILLEIHVQYRKKSVGD